MILKNIAKLKNKIIDVIIVITIYNVLIYFISENENLEFISKYLNIRF
jgi:hypothetical protein